MADLSQPNNLFSEPNDHLSHLLAPEMDEPWYKSFFQNIKDMVNPPKLPPLVLTSKPVPVKDIWGLYGRQKKSFAMSTGGQVLIELVLMHLALSARDAAFPGQFSIETSAVYSEDTGDGYAIVTVTPPALGRDLPALDEIVRQSEGEIRFSLEDGAVKLYLPAVFS